MPSTRTTPQVSVATDIHAPRQLVWNVHTDVNAWSSWQPDIAYAVVEQPLTPGAPFRWCMHGMQFTSTVDAVDRGVHIQWRSVCHELTGTYEWVFTDTPTGVRVAAAASLSGSAVDADPAGTHRLLERSLTFWLSRLKQIAES